MKHLKFYLIACFTLVIFAQQGLAQSKAPSADIVNTIRDMKVKYCNFLEVSEEMFRLMSNDERAEGRMKEYFSKLNLLVFLQCHPTPDNINLDLSAEFEKIAKNNNFRLLILSKSQHLTNAFYKRENGDVNEYLLASQDRIQYLSTTLNITSFREMNQILSIAGEAGGM